MNEILALTAFAGLVLGASAECTSVADAATQAGLTTLVETITSLSDLPDASDLLAVVTATEPVEDKVTIFAPQNAGFQEISEEIPSLTEENVLSLILHHIVPDAFSAAHIIDLIGESSPASLDTLGGSPVEAELKGQDVIASPSGTSIESKVVVTDVQTCAGVVHVVDTVLVPRVLDHTDDASSGSQVASPDPDEDSSDFDDASLASVAPEDAFGPMGACVPLANAALEANLTSLVDAIEAVMDLPAAAALQDAVFQDQEMNKGITVFAPTNAAFDLISDVVSTLSPEDILNVLLNHVVPQELMLSDLQSAITAAAPTPAKVETLLNTTLEASLDGADPVVSPTGTDIEAMISVVDVETCAGVVHVVDKVLVPAADSPAPPKRPASPSPTTRGSASPDSAGPSSTVESTPTSSALSVSAVSGVLAVLSVVSLL